MPTIANVPHSRHAPQTHVTPSLLGVDQHGHEHTFDPGAVFVPVRVVPEPDEPLACEPLHRHLPPAADLGPIVAVDLQSTLGAWRRQWCDSRCASEITARHPEAVVWFASGLDGVRDEPPAPGEPVEWPADAVGGAA